MKKYVLVLSLLSTLISKTVMAQSGLGFYHMAREVPHGTNTSPIFFPDAGLYLGLWGAQFSVASPYDAKDLTTSDGLYNIDLLTSDLDNKDFISFGAEVYAMNLGLKINPKSYITFFANGVSENVIQVPKSALNFLKEGNGAFAGSTYEIDDIRVGSNTYAEAGFGYMRKFTLKNKPLLVGMRFKYLVGVAHVSVDNDAKATVTTNTDGTINFSVENGIARSAGLIADDAYSFDSRGFAVDFGGEYNLTDKLSVSFTARDLGAIKWKQNSTKIYRVENSSFEYSGVDDLADPDLSEIGDTLESSFNTSDYKEAFSKALQPEFYYGARYNMFGQSYASLTMANYVKEGRLQTGFGVGATINLISTLTLSGTVAKVPENGIDFGAGLALRLAILQMYVAVDGLSSLNVSNASYGQVNAGMSLMFGRPRKKEKEKIARKAEKKLMKQNSKKIKKEKKEDLGDTAEDRAAEEKIKQEKELEKKYKELDEDKKKFEENIE